MRLYIEQMTIQICHHLDVDGTAISGLTVPTVPQQLKLELKIGNRNSNPVLSATSVYHVEPGSRACASLAS